MSSIPSTSDHESVHPAYTVIGSERRNRGLRSSYLFSVVILNRGPRVQREETIAYYSAMDPDEIVCVERADANCDFEALTRRFERLRCILLPQAMNPGYEVNVAMSEVTSRYVLVVWNDTRVQAVSPRIVERLGSADVVCVVPIHRNERTEVLPSVYVPAYSKNRFRVFPMVPMHEKTPTIMIHDYVGLYDRERYLLLGGYDAKIDHPYWQKLDFGLRTFLWNDRLVCNITFRGQRLIPAEPEETTPNDAYRRFYLKNLAVRFSEDHATLPTTRFPAFARKSGRGVVSAWREFDEVRQWVRTHTYRFVRDASAVAQLWEVDA